jgi:hypothetical protein
MLGALKVSHLLMPVALTQGDQIGQNNGIWATF